MHGVRCRFHSADRPDRVSRGLRRTLWFLTAATVTAALVTGAASSRTPSPGSPGGGGAGEVAIFYYPWYGTVAVDGSWQHWQQNGNDPPASIASNWFPAAWRLLLVRRGRRARADARDRVDRRADRDRLVVGAGIDGGRSASPRRTGCPRCRAAGRVARRAVRRTNACDARPAVARLRVSGRDRRLHLRLDGERRQRLEGSQQAAGGHAALRQHEPARQGRGGRIRGSLHLRRPHLRRDVVPPHVRVRPHAQLAVCAVGRPGLRCRACDRRHAHPGSGRTARPTTACGGARSVPPPTSSRSRATTSGTREHRSSRLRQLAAPYSSYDGAYGLTGRAAERAYLDRTAAWVRAYRDKVGR